MTVPQASDVRRSDLFETRTARLEPVPIPKGSISPTLVEGGDVFVSTQGQYSPKVDSMLRAVDPATGLERWNVRLPADIVTAPVPSADGKTVWAPGEGMLRAFSASTGEAQGSWGPGTLECLRPVPLSGDVAVVAGWKDLFVAALRPGSAKPLWETEVGVACGPAAIGPGRVYTSVFVDFEGKAGAVQALDSATGEPVWRYESDSPISESPATGADGVVYVSGSEGSVVALDPQTGKPLWKAATEGRPATAAVSRDGEHVLVGDSKGFLQALDAETGEQVWKVGTGGPVRLAPGVGPDGLLCVVGGDHHLTVVDDESGLVKARLDVDGIPGATPVPLEDGSFLVWSLAGQTEKVLLPSQQHSAPAAPEETPEETPEILVSEADVCIGGVRIARR